MQRKGLPLLIRAAGAVLARLPGTEFWVVGQDKAAQRMKNLCRSFGISHVSLFRPALPGRAAGLLRAGGRVCHALARGGVRRRLPGSDGCRVPVIGTRVGGIPELIEHESNGLLAEPEDAAGLAELLCRVFADAGLQDRLRENGRRTARQFTQSA